MLIVAAAFIVAAAAIVVTGPRMARTADRLADVTGLGGALFGVIFLALATDLPEVALISSAAVTGTPRVAVGNLLGSAAAQLLLIAAVDFAYRRGQLYRDLPVATGVGQAALMLSVLATPLVIAPVNPGFGWVGLGTLLLPLAYVGGLAAMRGITAGEPHEVIPHDIDVAPEEPRANESDDRDAAESTAALWRAFAGLALVLMAAGIALEWSAEQLGTEIGLDQTAAGALLAGVVTPLPEMVTAISAVRSGALELAVGNLVGSSALDVALLSVADVVYTDGSIFDLIGGAEITLIGVSLGLTSLLVLGLARRQPAGRGRIGVESYLMVGVYVLGAVLLVLAGE